MAGTDVPIAEIEKLIPPYKVSFLSPPALYLPPAWCERVQLCGEQQRLHPLPSRPKAYGEWTTALPPLFFPSLSEVCFRQLVSLSVSLPVNVSLHA